MILSDDPTAVDPETLANLQIMATIKEGTVIYRAEPTPGSGDLAFAPPLAGDPKTAERLLHAFSEGLNGPR